MHTKSLMKVVTLCVHCYFSTSLAVSGPNHEVQRLFYILCGYSLFLEAQYNMVSMLSD